MQINSTNTLEPIYVQGMIPDSVRNAKLIETTVLKKWYTFNTGYRFHGLR